VHSELKPLTLHDTIHYVQHRLTLAGATGRPFFTPAAMRSIHRVSKGIPRVINNLCDKALLSAFVRDSDEVNYWDVRRAIKEVSTLT
jgi:general secretion pathway protein A